MITGALGSHRVLFPKSVWAAYLSDQMKAIEWNLAGSLSITLVGDEETCSPGQVVKRLRMQRWCVPPGHDEAGGGGVESCRPDRCGVTHCACQGGRIQVGTRQVSATQIGQFESRAFDHRTRQIGAAQVRRAQVRPIEPGMPQDRSPEVGLVQVCVDECSAGQPNAGQIRTS